VHNLSIKFYRIYIMLYHVIYIVWYYPRFHVTAVGLGTYYRRIRGSACNSLHQKELFVRRSRHIHTFTCTKLPAEFSMVLLKGVCHGIRINYVRWYHILKKRSWHKQPFYSLKTTVNITNIKFQKEMNQKEGNNLGFEFLCSINRGDYFYGQLAG